MLAGPPLLRVQGSLPLWGQLFPLRAQDGEDSLACCVWDALALKSEACPHALVEFAYRLRVLADAMDCAGALGATPVLAGEGVGQPADLSYAAKGDLGIPSCAQELEAHTLEVLSVIGARLHSLNPRPRDAA